MTRVGPPTAFARGALILITETFFPTSPPVCALQAHYRIPVSLYPPSTTYIFTCRIAVVSVLCKAKQQHLDFSFTRKPEAHCF